jgi:hypothetical protein
MFACNAAKIPCQKATRQNKSKSESGGGRMPEIRNYFQAGLQRLGCFACCFGVLIVSLLCAWK